MAVQPNGDEFSLTNWLPVTINLNFDGIGMTFTTADIAQAAEVRSLLTDILLYRDDALYARMRVVDDEDMFDANGHTITFTCVGYETLLQRRIFHDSWEGHSGDQHDLGWQMIEHTQARPGGNLGITRAALKAGTNRSRTIERGATIAAAIDDIASVDGGFDWWIDAQLRWHAQTPRRERDLNRDLGWGQGITEITRSGAADTYASQVLVLGSQQEVTLPGGRPPYPPPKPILAKDAQEPFGLWEQTVSLPDIITDASLALKAAWALGQATSLRPSYRCVLEPNVWTPDMAPGDMFRLWIDSPPRYSHERASVRIEEVQIDLDPSGAENVSLSVRAEVSPTGEPIGTGRSTQYMRISPEHELGAILAGLRRTGLVALANLGGTRSGLP